ncbi:MAG: F0F1 ATP synthase subunit A [Candidatus Cyclobacteriaceae bacterium M3_2C_046]
MLLLSVGTISMAAEDHGEEAEAFDAGEMILHHIADSHEWHFWEGATLYLPVILYSEKSGFEVFSSSNFYDDLHENVSYRGFRLDHGDIIHVDGTADVYDFSITKNVFQMFLSVILMFWVFLSMAKRYKNDPNRPPKGIAAFFEPIVVFIRDDVAKPNIGPKYQKYLPYLLSLFFFIWFNNVIGLLPGAANVTGNLAVTGVLAIFTFIITQVSGTKHYWNHVFNTPGVPWWLKWGIPIMPLVEFIGLFTKPFSLMVRLFANITAGHIIILSLFSLIFIFQSIYVGPISVLFATFMNFLELFVALLQAYIFTLLSAMYFGGAVEEHHEHEEEATDQALV